VVRETDDPEVVVTEITHYGQSNVTGAPYRFTALGVIRVRDGEIIRYDDYMDRSPWPTDRPHQRTRRRSQQHLTVHRKQHALISSGHCGNGPASIAAYATARPDPRRYMELIYTGLRVLSSVRQSLANNCVIIVCTADYDATRTGLELILRDAA